MEPRIIGLMGVWGRELFVEAAVRQALEMFGMDLYVTTTCYLPQLMKYRDNSEVILRSFQEPTYVHCQDIVDFDCDFNANSAKVHTRLLKEAQPHPGEYVFIVDVDEFYTEGAAEKILQRVKNGDFSSLRMKSRFIGPDMSHYIGHSHIRLHRYSPDRHFRHGIVFSPGFEETILEDNPMFHYSFAVDPRYKAEFWKHEGKGVDQSIRIEWLQQIFGKYDPENEKKWMRKNEELTGHHGFCFNDECEEAEGGGLFTLERDHPRYAQKFSIPSIGDFREFFGTLERSDMDTERPPIFQPPQKKDAADAVDEPTGSSECGSPPPAAAPSPEARSSLPGENKSMKVDFYKREGNGCTLVAGPYGGEFGYELMMWTPALRSLSAYFEKIVIVIHESQEFLYEDFADEIIYHTIDLGKNRWKANSGDARFWQGEWGELADEELLGKVQNNILSREYPNPVYLDPIPALWEMPSTYYSFRSTENSRVSDSVALHCRRAGHGRDWDSGKWDTLAALLHEDGFDITVVGTATDYCPEAPCIVDNRGASLRATADILSNVSMLIGGSSGIMHFGALCETPLLVWGDADFSIPEVGTSREAYETEWNPYGVPVHYMDTGWDPNPYIIKKALSNFGEMA